MRDLATFVVSALLALGIGSFVVCFLLGLLRHFSWRARARRRIGWYT